MKLRQFTVWDTGIGKFLLSISFRLLLFNIIIVFIPVASLLYLDIYEKQLLEAQEKAMVQQARLFSAALSNRGGLDPAGAERLLDNLAGRTDSRLRVIDSKGYLVADSSRNRQSSGEAGNTRSSTAYSTKIPGIEESILYRAATYPVRVYRKLFNPPVPVEDESFYSSTDRFGGAEVEAALEGRYGAVTRLSSGGQNSVTLYTAIPITEGDDISGAVLCSQSTYKILENLYELRVSVLKVFLWLLLFSVLVSLLLSFSISHRLKMLKNSAESIRSGRNGLEGDFDSLPFRDEIGILSESLRDLTSRLDRHIRNSASFVQDFIHEFRNPLSVVASAADMVSDSDAEEKLLLSGLIIQNSRRMESLLEGTRELSLIDRDLEKEKKSEILLKPLIENAAAGFRISHPGKTLVIDIPDDDLPLKGTEDKLSRILVNLLENAVSFSEETKPVVIKAGSNRAAGNLRLTVSNTGPLIPEKDLERIFNRFYSNRPDSDPVHNGLGLSIVRTIVQSYGGTVRAENHPDGPVFIVELPL